METKIYLNLIKNWTKIIAEVNFIDVAAPLIQNKVIAVDDYRSIVSGNENGMERCLVLLLKKEEHVLLKFAEVLKKDYSWLSDDLMEGYLANREDVDETDALPIISLEVNGEIGSSSCLQRSITSNNNNNRECSSNTFNNSSPLIFSNVKNKDNNIRRKKFKKSRVKSRDKGKLKNSFSTISSTTSELINFSLNERVTDEVISIIRKSPLVSKSWTTIAHSLGLTDRVHEIRYKVIIHGEDLSMCVVYLIKDWLEMFSESATLSKLIEVLRCEGFNNVSDKLCEILHGKKNGVLTTP